MQSPPQCRQRWLPQSQQAHQPSGFPVWEGMIPELLHVRQKDVFFPFPSQTVHLRDVILHYL